MAYPLSRRDLLKASVAGLAAASVAAKAAPAAAAVSKPAEPIVHPLIERLVLNQHANWWPHARIGALVYQAFKDSDIERLIPVQAQVGPEGVVYQRDRDWVIREGAVTTRRRLYRNIYMPDLVEALHDETTVHGFSMGNEIASVMATMIQRRHTRVVLQETLRSENVGTTERLKTPEDVAALVRAASERIRTREGSRPANWVVAPRLVSDLLSGHPEFEVAADYGQFVGLLRLDRVGVLSGRWTVYTYDGWNQNHKMVVGRKWDQFEGGLLYAPYIPLLPKGERSNFLEWQQFGGQEKWCRGPMWPYRTVTFPSLGRVMPPSIPLIEKDEDGGNLTAAWGRVSRADNLDRQLFQEALELRHRWNKAGLS